MEKFYFFKKSCKSSPKKSNSNYLDPQIHTTRILFNKQKSFRINQYDCQNSQNVIRINLLLSKNSNALKIQMQDLKFIDNSQNLEKIFERQQQEKQLQELLEYYKFFMNCPTISHNFFNKFMVKYWNHKKTFYYNKIRRNLNLQDAKQMSSNALNFSFSRGDSSQQQKSSTFYVLNFLQQKQITNSFLKQNETITELIKGIKGKHKNKKKLNNTTIEDIDRCYNFFDNRKLYKSKKTLKQNNQHHSTTANSNKDQFKKKITNKNFQKYNQKPYSSMDHGHGIVNTPKSKSKKKYPNSKVRSCENLQTSPKSILRKNSTNIAPSFRKHLKKQSSTIKFKQLKKYFKNTKQKQQVKKEHSNIHKKNRSDLTIKLKQQNRINTCNSVKSIIKGVKNKIKQEKSIVIKKFFESKKSVEQTTHRQKNRKTKIKKK